MAGAFVKVFGSILASSIWSEPESTRIVWIAMLVMADADGNVWGSVPGIARIAGVSLKAARVAVNKLCSPDPDSRTPDHEGRRLLVVEGGWHVINARKYREMQTDGQRKASERSQKYRDGLKQAVEAAAKRDESDASRASQAVRTEEEGEVEVDPEGEKETGSGSGATAPTAPASVGPGSAAIEPTGTPSPSEPDDRSAMGRVERKRTAARATHMGKWTAETVVTTKRVIAFYNAVWGKALGLETPGNIATVAEALDAGYTEEQLRAAVFASRWATDWFRKHKRDLSLILRFKCPKGEARILDGLITQGFEIDFGKSDVRAAADAVGMSYVIVGPEPAERIEAKRAAPPPMTQEQRERIERVFSGVDTATRFPVGGEAHRKASE